LILFHTLRAAATVEKQQTLFDGIFASRSGQENTRNHLFQIETRTLTELGRKVGHYHHSGTPAPHDV